jgi:hypothetical protein
MSAKIATEGGQTGQGGATKAISGELRDNLTPLSFGIEKNGHLSIKAYNGDGYFSTYYVDLTPDMLKRIPDEEGGGFKEVSRLLDMPREATGKAFVGEYPNLARGEVEYRLEDVLNRAPRDQQGVYTSHLKRVEQQMKDNPHLFDNETFREYQDSPTVENLKKANHVLINAATNPRTKTMLDRIEKSIAKRGRLEEGDLKAFRKSLEEDPSLANMGKLCSLFNLNTKGLK